MVDQGDWITNIHRACQSQLIGCHINVVVDVDSGQSAILILPTSLDVASFPHSLCAAWSVCVAVQPRLPSDDDEADVDRAESVDGDKTTSDGSVRISLAHNYAVVSECSVDCATTDVDRVMSKLTSTVSDGQALAARTAVDDGSADKTVRRCNGFSEREFCPRDSDKVVLVERLSVVGQDHRYRAKRCITLTKRARAAIDRTDNDANANVTAADEDDDDDVKAVGQGGCCAPCTRVRDHHFIRTADIGLLPDDDDFEDDDEDDDEQYDDDEITRRLLKSASEVTTTTSTRPQLFTPRQPKTPTKRGFDCHLCKQRIYGDEEVHMRRKHTVRIPEKMKLFTCHICGVTLKLASKSYHLNRFHKINAKEYPCDKCDRVFYTQVGHADHQNVHNDEKPYVCVYCGKAYSSRTTFKQCQSKCSGCIHECQRCPKKFWRQSSLRVHMREMHSSIRPLACHVCSYKTPRRYVLKQHYAKAHQIAEDDIPASSFITNHEPKYPQALSGLLLLPSSKEEKGDDGDADDDEGDNDNADRVETASHEANTDDNGQDPLNKEMPNTNISEK